MDWPIIDYNRVFERVPEIMGLDLVFRKDAWEGRYYITGAPHRYKRDKLKVKLYKGIMVYEQGGECMSLVQWLVEYGGCAGYKEAFAVIRGSDKIVREYKFSERVIELNYVPKSDMEAMRGFELQRCSLFVWMVGLFGEARTRETWNRYNAMSDGNGNAVFWYVDKDGRVCHDKVMRYRLDGHRDRGFGGSRRYKVRDGYSGRCLFGEHLTGEVEKIFVCESEKDALIMNIVTGNIVVATGGKSNLIDVTENMVLLPDVDAADEWEAKAAGKCKVLHWWDKYPQHGGHDGVGDYLLWWWGRKV